MPYVSTTESSETSWTTSHSVSLGSSSPGDHLLLSFGTDGSGGTITAPSGWTPVLSIDLNSNQKWRVWIRNVDGSESSSLTIATSVNNRSVAHVLRFSGQRTGTTEGTTWDVASTTSGYGTQPNPPSVTASWGSGDQTFVALAYAAGNSPTVSTFPTSYSNTNDIASRAMVASATRAVTGTSDDPSTFVLSGSNNHRAATVVLREAATIIAGAEVATATGTAYAPDSIDPPTTIATAEVATGTGQAYWASPTQDAVASDLVVEWDFDGDGDFDQTVEDITDRVIGGSMMRGRDYASQITGRSTPGQLSLLLRNDDNAFNYFNTSSTLNTSPYSLAGGRLIRVRTSESTPTDPTELARASFGGTGALTTLDTGETWTHRFGGWSEFAGQGIADGPPDPSSGQIDLSTFPVGQNSYFAQVRISRRDGSNEVGLVFDWTDANNYNFLYLSDGKVEIWEVDTGVAARLVEDGAENRDDIALGLAHHSDGSLIAYIDGQAVVSTTSNITTTDVLGLYSKWYYQRAPALDELRVWDRARIVQSWDTTVDQSGVLATMKVTKVEPEVDENNRRVARITATGVLRQLERPVTPPASTGPDDVQSFGIRSGQVVGNLLHKVGLLHPPAKIDVGDVQVGSVGFNRQRAIQVARAAEETEAGFLYETVDGGVAFDKRTARDGSSVVATFTDDPLVPGFAFERPRQRDWEGDIINRVRSEVSPMLPRGPITGTHFANTSLGVANDVAITLPSEGTGDTDAAVGDLLIIAVASTVQADNTFWLTPAGWTPLRVLTDEYGGRVYAKKLAAGDFGTSVTFYDDVDNAGGGWAAVHFLVKNWFGVLDSGVAITEFDGRGGGSTQAEAGDNDPPVMFTPWPIGPTMFLPLRFGIQGDATTGATQQSASDDIAPNGYDTLGSHSIFGVANTEDCGVQWARRIRTEQVQDPSPFGGQFTGYQLVETCVIAVRGFAGSPPPASGGLAVIDQNVASQIDREAILDHPHPGTLFKDETDAAAYNDHVLGRFDQDRPIFEVSFTATRDQRTRDMCATMDLSDRVRIDADGTSGFGFDAEFFVETIVDTFGEGATLWRRGFRCSPATDAGGGAD